VFIPEPNEQSAKTTGIAKPSMYYNGDRAVPLWVRAALVLDRTEAERFDEMGFRCRVRDLGFAIFVRSDERA
jgi:hypothetical protein